MTHTTSKVNHLIHKEDNMCAQSLSFFVRVYIYFWLCWVFVAVWAFSSCGEQGLLSSCGAQASPCHGFSYCGDQALEHRLNSYIAQA